MDCVKIPVRLLQIRQLRIIVRSDRMVMKMQHKPFKWRLQSSLLVTGIADKHYEMPINKEFDGDESLRISTISSKQRNHMHTFINTPILYMPARAHILRLIKLLSLFAAELGGSGGKGGEEAKLERTAHACKSAASRCSMSARIRALSIIKSYMHLSLPPRW